MDESWREYHLVKRWWDRLLAGEAAHWVLSHVVEGEGLVFVELVVHFAGFSFRLVEVAFFSVSRFAVNCWFCNMASS